VEKLGNFMILPFRPDCVLKTTTHLSPVTMGEEEISPLNDKVPVVDPVEVLMHVSLLPTCTTE
jgi:hypothetical protein